MKKLLLTLALVSSTNCLNATEKQITKSGNIILFTGPMASGKSRRLIQILETKDPKKIIAFQHKLVATLKGTALRTRYNTETIPAIHTDNPQEMADVVQQKKDAPITYIGIDEAQFFDSSIREILINLKNAGCTIIIAALDDDFRRKPFPTTQIIKEIADYIVYCTDGRCYQCGIEGAECTVRLHGDTPAKLDEPVVKVGDLKAENAQEDDTHYQPCCSACYKKLYPDFATN